MASAAADVDEEGRHSFMHDGRLIYKWKQTLAEVLLYIFPPPGLAAKHLDVCIKTDHFSIGLKGNPPFINEALHSTVVVSESMWMLDDGVIEVNLQKVFQGETWPSALKGHGTMNPVVEQAVKKEMMLERFQQENPGFDFSQAEFNGTVPDPRNFMGGIKRT